MFLERKIGGRKMIKKINRKRMVLHENPFNTSEPIRNPEDFFGREEEITNVLRSLFRSERRGQCTSIVGERRIGKTSFVNMLMHEEILRSHNIDVNKCIIVYINIAERMAISQEKLLGYILNELTKKEDLNISSYKEEDNIYDRIVSVLDEIKNKKGIMIFLDEFEAICDIWDTKLDGWLRALSQHHSVDFVTVSKKPLAKIRCKANRETQISPFHNIFVNFTLGLLDEGSSRKMIKEMFKKGGIKLDEDEVELLSEISGNNPFFIQLFGSLYFDSRINKEKNQIDLDSFKNEAFRQGKTHFEHCWNNLDEVEREYLRELKEGQSCHKLSVGYDLERRGLIRKEKEKFFFFSPFFGRFIDETVEETRISLGQKPENFLGRILKNRRNICILLISVSLGCGISFKWLGSQLIIGTLASILGPISMFLILRLIKPKNH